MLKGAPVADVWILFNENSPSGRYAFAVSDSEGVFSVDLPASNYEGVTYYDPTDPDEHFAPYLPLVVVTEGQTTDLGDLEVVPSPRTVSGAVSDGIALLDDVFFTCAATIGGRDYVLWTSTGPGAFDFSFRLAEGDWKMRAFRSSGSGQLGVNVAGSDISGLEILIFEAVFSRWAANYELLLDDGQSGADPDGDGYDNLQEFAFGSDPTKPTSALAQTTRTGSNFTLSWLERTDGLMSYSARGSSDPRRWQAAPVQVGPGTTPAPPEGYVRRQFTVPATGKNFYRVAAAKDSGAVPAESFTMNVAGAPVTVERWGTGPKALVFFGYIPFFMEENLKNEYAGDFAKLLGEEYSMFLWTYPDTVSPFSEALDRFDQYSQNPTAAWAAAKVAFTGVTTSVVSQIRAATGITEVCLVANSFGAGVVLWDFAALSADPKVRFVLISPTELYMPALASLPSANPLPRTVLLADAAGDQFFNPANSAVRSYVSARANVDPLPGVGHFVIGQSPIITLRYVFDLIDEVYQQP